MNAKEVIADFQFLGNRVVKLTIETKTLEEKGRVDLSFDFKYKTEVPKSEGIVILGILQLTVQVKAKIKNKILFKIDLVMEGGFTGNSEKIPREKFAEMLEMNGLITLMHISRAYLIGVTAQSGINPPVRIPMVNVMRLRELKHKSQKEE